MRRTVDAQLYGKSGSVLQYYQLDSTDDIRIPTEGGDTVQWEIQIGKLHRQFHPIRQIRLKDNQDRFLRLYLNSTYYSFFSSLEPIDIFIGLVIYTMHAYQWPWANSYCYSSGQTPYTPEGKGTESGFPAVGGTGSRAYNSVKWRLPGR